MAGRLGRRWRRGSHDVAGEGAEEILGGGLSVSARCWSVRVGFPQGAGRGGGRVPTRSEIKDEENGERRKTKWE
jgi:hypothetical protein